MLWLVLYLKKFIFVENLNALLYEFTMTFSKEEIQNFIAEALEVDKKKISINSSSKNIENWDSLGQLNILQSLDQKLDGKVFSMKELVKAKSVKQILNILKSHNFIK